MVDIYIPVRKDSMFVAEAIMQSEHTPLSRFLLVRVTGMLHGHLLLFQKFHQAHDGEGAVQEIYSRAGVAGGQSINQSSVYHAKLHHWWEMYACNPKLTASRWLHSFFLPYLREA